MWDKQAILIGHEKTVMLNLDYLFNIGDRSQCSPVVTILDSDGNEIIGKSGWEFYTVD